MEDYPEDESADLDQSIEIYEQLEEVSQTIQDFVERYRERGYNIGIMVHTYDPLLKESNYVGDIVGDRYAVLGCLQEWIRDS